MKTLTFKTAILLGFDYEKSTFETREELEQDIMDFLVENVDELPVQEDYCEVSGNGSKQHVNYGGYSSSGEIISYDADLLSQPVGTKIYHSNFLEIDEKTGECFNFKLYELVVKNDLN